MTTPRLAPISCAAAIALVALACTPAPEPLPFEPAGPNAAPDPSTFGPYPVGVRTVTLVDDTRTSTDGGPRTLVTEIWYPAVETARGKPGTSYDIRELLTDEQREMLSDMPEVLLETRAVRDAEPRRDRGAFPLVLFSHGHSGMRWQSTFYTVALASHGYVVIAPDHEDGTLSDTLRDKLDSVVVLFDKRPADGTFLLDVFTDLPDEDPLAEIIDVERIGVSGHSFGGFTSLRMAAMDERVKAIVPQTPPSADIAFLGMPKGFVLDKPTMLQIARLDQTLPHEKNGATLWPTLSAPRIQLDIVQGGHFTYSDLCAFDLSEWVERLDLSVGLSSDDIQGVLSDGCEAPAPVASVAQPLINHFAIGFFNATLRGSTGSWALLSQEHATRLASGEAEVMVDR